LNISNVKTFLVEGIKYNWIKGRAARCLISACR